MSEFDIQATPGNRSITVNWTSPGGTIAKYAIIITYDGNSTTIDNIPGISTEYTITGLINGRFYDISMLAYDDLESQEPVAISNAETAVTPTTTFGSFTLNAVPGPGSGQVTLTWTTPSGGPITEYKIYVDGGYNISVYTGNTYTVSDLVNDRENPYAFYITAVSDVQDGSSTDIVYATPTATPPQPPSAPCLAKGTRVLTNNGYKAVETLEKDDRIVSSDGRLLPFKLYSFAISKADKRTAPYLVKKNAYGLAKPSADILVSPLHAIQMRKGVWDIPCKSENKRVVQVNLGEPVEYYHIELPDYFKDNLICEGLVTESFGGHQVKPDVAVYRECVKLGGFLRGVYKVDETNRMKMH